jgi:hypothetical protein
VAVVTVIKADGTMWTVDESQLSAKLPDEPPLGSFAQATTATGLLEYAHRLAGWIQVDDPAQAAVAWTDVIAADTTGRPAVVFTPQDRDDLLALIRRVKVDGASVLTVEGNRLQCASNPAGGNVTARFGATVNHLSKIAAARFALGLLGADAALIGGGPL